MTSDTPPHRAGEDGAAPAGDPPPCARLAAGSGEGSYSAMQRLQLLREREEAHRARRVADAGAEEDSPPAAP